MIKEPKDIDFSTSGRQLSTEDFALISQWIAQDKKQSAKATKGLRKGQKSLIESADKGVIGKREL